MDKILYPLMWVISWVMTIIHKGLTLIGFEDGSGAAWIVSVVGLTIIIRALIIPLYTRQIRASRDSQRLQPELQKIQKKYKGKRDPVSQRRMQEETQALYRDAGTSPFAACMPALIQIPIFFSLYRMLYAVKPIAEGSYYRPSIGPIDVHLAKDIESSTFFGAPLSSSFGMANQYENPTAVRVVAVALIVWLCLSLFFTQWQLLTKNMPESAKDPSNPMYRTQRMMMYLMPLMYIFSGSFFQVGVLIYWGISNLWNIGQQSIMLYFNPTPGSDAHKKHLERKRQKRIAKGLPPEEEDPQAPVRPVGQRQQPMSKKRAKKAGVSADSFLEGPGDSALADAQKTAGTSGADAGSASGSGEDTTDDVVGPDGLTEAERQRKRYERRLAERQRSQAKKQARDKRAQQNKKKRNF